VDGTVVKSVGLVQYNGDYYYITDSGKVYVGSIYVAASKTNGLKPSQKYEFGADGKMIINNGIVDGVYYVDGTVVKSVGLVQYNGDYYYITDSGKVYVGSIYVAASKTNGLKPSQKYEFGADGKMINN